MSEIRKPIESLKFENLTFCFEGHSPVLNHCDFEFPMNEIVWLKSSEGAGKTTLLQILAVLESAHSGKLRINQEDTSEMTFEEFLPYRLNIGYSFDYGGLLNNQTLVGNLMLPLVYHKFLSREDAQAKALEWMKKFEIDRFALERPAHVPGRVRKLVCVLRTMITEPQMIILDDPSVGLGQETLLTLVDHLNDMREKGYCRHVFISSYDEKFMSMFNYQLVHLDGGLLYFESVDPQKKVVHL